MLSFNKKENTQVTYTDNYVTIFSMFFFFFLFFRLHSKQMRSRMCLVEQGVTELPNSAVNKVIPTLIYIYLKCFFFFTVEV